MPNWCQNFINITAEKELFEKFNIDKEFLFKNILPLPKEQEDNWYRWQIDNWGTKWDICDPDLEIREVESGKLLLSGFFETAWSPPLKLYEYMSSNGFSIVAYYHECGVQFYGHYMSETQETYGYDNFNEIPQFYVSMFDVVDWRDREEC